LLALTKTQTGKADLQRGGTIRPAAAPSRRLRVGVLLGVLLGDLPPRAEDDPLLKPLLPMPQVWARWAPAQAAQPVLCPTSFEPAVDGRAPAGTSSKRWPGTSCDTRR
jgi:hypothetical protein